MLQSEASECGLVCLAFASARLGAYHELTSLRQRFPVSTRGLNLKQLTEIASGLDMVSRGVKCELDDPSLIAPLYANLFEDKGHDTYSLIWSRSLKKRID
jgi:ATP-binding cassette subfamily B protein RaxB